MLIKKKKFYSAGDAAPYYKVGAGGGGWTPASLPNLFAWYKPDAGVYSDAGTTLATNGQGVYQWNDQSGNGHHVLQASSANRPIYNSGGSHGYLVFSKTNITPLRTPTGSVNLNGGSALLSIYVAAHVSATDWQQMINYAADTHSWQAGGMMFAQTGAGNNSVGLNGFVGGFTAVPWDFDTFGICGFITDVTPLTTIRMEVGGGALNSSTSTAYYTPHANGTLCIGGYLDDLNDTGFTAPYDGTFYEIVIVKGTISSGDRTSLVTYLGRHP